MSDSGFAKLFMNGRSQAVRLPRQFRMAGKQVRVRRLGSGVLLEPVLDTADWFEAMDRLDGGDFMAGGRSQPESPERDLFD